MGFSTDALTGMFNAMEPEYGSRVNLCRDREDFRIINGLTFFYDCRLGSGDTDSIGAGVIKIIGAFISSLY